MIATKFQIFLAVLMVVSGSLITISVKWMDMLQSMGISEVHSFDHPLVQADFMFLGEIWCLVVFVVAYKVLQARRDGTVEENVLTKGSRVFNRFILWPPAFLDIIASTTMYFGLTMTNASSFQMLRGSVIVFVAILSRLILKRKIETCKWIGIALIICGLVLVGLADVSAATEDKTVVGYAIQRNDFRQIFNNHEKQSRPEQANNIIKGDCLIIFAQIVTAFQMVYEENFVTKLDIPALQVAGWEGAFGFLTLSFYLCFNDVAQSDVSNTSVDAVVQISNNWRLAVAVIILVFSVAFFNYAGVQVTKEMSATTRMVLDSVRTLTVWLFSLTVGWQVFHFIQVITTNNFNFRLHQSRLQMPHEAINQLHPVVIKDFLKFFQLFGFFFLISGMCVYNNLLVPNVMKCIDGIKSKYQHNKTEEAAKDSVLN